MLTKETITANEALKDLTDAQVDALCNLSKNDENAVIGAKIGEIYRQMDATIETATGVTRNGDEKTYVYLERASKAIAENANAKTKENGQLKTEIERLNKVIADGVDAETKQALQQAKKDADKIKGDYNALKKAFDDAEIKHKSEILDVRLQGEINNATSGLTFNEQIPETARNILISQAIAKIKSFNPQYIDGGNGTQIMAFHDANGAIMRNPENQLNPYTASELVSKELKAMGVLASPLPNKGSGANPQGNPTNNTTDASGYKTRSEAMKGISKMLMDKGLSRGSAEFQTEMDKIWKDFNISSLPEK